MIQNLKMSNFKKKKVESFNNYIISIEEIDENFYMDLILIIL